MLQSPVVYLFQSDGVALFANAFGVEAAMMYRILCSRASDQVHVLHRRPHLLGAIRKP